MSDTVLFDHEKEVAAEVYDAALRLLRQYTDFLNALAAENLRSYTAISTYVPGSTIGKHVRHVLDHFRILLRDTSNQAEAVRQVKQAQGIHDDDSPENGTEIVDGARGAIKVNYDERQRDDPYAALASIEEIRQSLLRIAASKMRLDTHVALEATLNPRKQDVPFSSSFGRELWFVCHHAIHHAALQRAICVEYNIPVSDDFGVAPSTVKHHLQHEKAEQ
ncbi:hypothetical protein SpCBS45565_g06891 [Spizellomyces sp. 'palustris']|nr:hypothetical protein SpCBS45565_g06891 [Spizellomyces sp. 'palustris']